MGAQAVLALPRKSASLQPSSNLVAMAKAMKAMKVMKKKAAMKAMKAMKKKAVTAMPKSGIAAAIADSTELKKKVKPARAAGKKMMFGKEVKVKAAKAKTFVK